jgi:uncharacterized delta-60 repeat protein
MSANANNPYIGPRTFQENERDRFFGREREAAELLALVVSEPLVLFYAQSGAGKSSLVNTCLIPDLKAKGFEVLVGRVGGDVSSQMEVRNIFVYNLMCSLATSEFDSGTLRNLSLDEFFTRFLYATPQNTIPDNTERVSRRRALIIDQFEELFSTHHGEWEKRQGFFQELVQVMENDPHLRVILIIREDYIAALDPYAYLLPSRLRMRYHMQQLEYEAALKAVKKPVQRTEFSRPYAAGVAERLVDDLRSTNVIKPDGTLDVQPGQFVEPLQLQVICYNLWENLPPGGTQITDSDLQAVGDVSISLGNYYAMRVKAVAEAQNVSEGKIRRWFTEKLISPDGIRNMVLRESSGMSGGLEKNAVQALSDLVRAEQRGGATFYELTHDRLVEPIIENNKNWFNENLSPLQRQASLWKDQGQNESWLLRGKAWAEVEQWGKDHQKELTDLEREFLEASRSFVERERRAKRLTRLIALMGVVAIVLAIFAYQATLDAKQQTKIAIARQLAAQAQSIYATGNSKQMTAVLLAVQSLSMFPPNEMYPSIEAIQVLQNDLLAQPISSIAHHGSVRSVAFSPDGKYVVSGSFDKTARVWEAETGKEIARMTHEDGVNSVAFSPDGKYVVSGSADRTARVWEAATGQEVARMTHEGGVTSVAFSPDGIYVVSGSLDTTARVWDAATGQEINRTTHEGGVTSVAFSPDGKYVVSGSDIYARVWEATTGKEVTSMPHEGGVESVTFSPDGQYVASGDDIYARVWEAKTGKEILSIDNGELVTSVAFSPDGRYIVSGSWNHIVQVWNVATGENTATMIHDSNVRSVAFSPDGKYVVSGGKDNTARVWEAATGLEIGRMTHNNTVWSVAFSPDGKYVASGGLDKLVRVWEATASKEVARIPQKERVWSVAFSPDGKYIVSGSGDFAVRVWERATGEKVADMTHDDEVFSVAFSPDGKYVVSGSEDHTVRVWERATGKEVARMTHDDEVLSAAFSPDGKYVVSGSVDKTARIWEAGTGKEIARMPHERMVNSVAFSPDGKYVVSGCEDFKVHVWEVATGEETATMAHDSNVRTAAFSPDGKYVVSGSADHTIRVWEWEATTGKEVARMTHESNVRSVAFSPDGKYIVSGSSDNTVRVWAWDATTSKEVTRMLHDDRLNSVAFSPDGKYVVSGAEDKVVRVWLWRPEDLIEKACARATRNLNRDEWKLYLGEDEPYRAVCPNLAMEPEIIPTATP